MVPKTEGGEAGAESKKKAKKKSKEKTGESCASYPVRALHSHIVCFIVHRHVATALAGWRSRAGCLPVQHHSCRMASQQLNVCTDIATATGSVVISKCCSSRLNEFPIALQVEDLHPQGW
jgi:hypothetical protein